MHFDKLLIDIQVIITVNQQVDNFLSFRFVRHYRRSFKKSYFPRTKMNILSNMKFFKIRILNATLYKVPNTRT